MKDLVIKKCMKCGAIVEVIEDCNCDDCGIRCCGEPMQALKPNSEDAAFEKHVPTYEIIGNDIVVKVNHVMEEEHYIEWIAYAGDKKIGKKFLKPGESASMIFPYEKGGKIYAYCNKHGLWCQDVD